MFPSVAAATSAFMIGATAAASAFVYYGRGHMELALTALVGILAGCLLVALMTLINRFRPGSAGNGVK